MPGRHRTSSKEESTGVLKFKQEAWAGGQNSDLPASTVAADEVPLLQDLVAFKSYVESHGGSKVFSNTVLPGSGTLHSYRFHQTAKKWVVHRGSAIWIAPATMTSWTQVTPYGASAQIVTKAGDATQLGGIRLFGLNSSNSNGGVTYWNLTNSGTTRTFSIYKDLAKTQLVARGQRTGDGEMVLLPQNNSGLVGEMDNLIYTGDDTDALNTLTGSLFGISYAIILNSNSTLRDLDNNMVLSVRGPGFTQNDLGGHFLINLADSRHYTLNAFHPTKKIVGHAAEVGEIHGCRVLYTFSRITDADGVADYSKNRISGILQHESGSVRPYVGAGELQADYSEFWFEDPISAVNPLTFYLTVDGTAGDSSLVQMDSTYAEGHFTHLSLYRCLDIGTKGTDPVTGAGNNREVYVWDQDIPFGSLQVSMTKTDEDLRYAYNKGFGLKSRFFEPLFNGECLEIAPTFLYVGKRGYPRAQYCQMLEKHLVGSHRRDKQFFNLDDGLQVIAKSPDLISFICAGKSWSSSPGVYKNVSTLESVFQLRHLIPTSTTIGVTDWSSFTEIRGGLFVAHCSDHTIRQWTGLRWSDDLSDRKVRKLVRKMPIGSTMGFCADALLLWHRTETAQTHNNKCLRYGFGGEAGHGWSTLARASWIFPPLYAGAARYQDASGVERLIALNNADGLFYWVETFDGPDGSGLAKLWLDKVAADGSGGAEIASAILFRERTGTDENNTIRHQETHLSLRPVDESVGYRGAFRVDITGFVDGSPTARETVINVPRAGDISYGKEHKGRRLQTRLDFAAAGFRITKAYFRDLEDDRRALGAGYAETNEGVYQRELSVSMKHWHARYKTRLNRASGRLYTLTGVAPGLVTGPDGKTYALSFGAGSYSAADSTSYSDFSFSFWVKGATLGPSIFALAGTPFYVSFPTNTQIDVSGQTFTVSTIAAGWHHFALVRSGSTVSIYQNGVLLGTVTVAGAVGGTSITWNPNLVSMQLDDWRIQTSSVSAAAWAFYYANVTLDGGSKVLP